MCGALEFHLIRLEDFLSLVLSFTVLLWDFRRLMLLVKIVVVPHESLAFKLHVITHAHRPIWEKEKNRSI